MTRDSTEGGEAEPRPEFENGVPFCTGFACEAFKRGNAGYYCALCDSYVDVRELCFPGVRAMAAELIQLRSRGQGGGEG